MVNLNRLDQDFGFGENKLVRWEPFDELHNDRLDPRWIKILKSFWRSEHGSKLSLFLSSRLQSGACIYPSTPFKALELTPFDSVNIVILGQDPYHGPGQAQGLAFSVYPGIKPPPSLVNIFKEIDRDPGIADFRVPSSGNLESWARSGVLLLNTTLTVEKGEPASHSAQGWEILTDQLILELACEKRPMVFMLWGAHAQSKVTVIKSSPGWSVENCLVLTSNHPSPLSASRGKTPFIGNCHFSLAQDWLAKRGIGMNWQL